MNYYESGGNKSKKCIGYDRQKTVGAIDKGFLVLLGQYDTPKMVYRSTKGILFRFAFEIIYGQSKRK